MHRLKLSHEFKYEFHEPRHVPLFMWLGKFYNARKLKHDLLIHQVEYHGLEQLHKLCETGDGVLIAPNHSDHADSALMLQMGLKIKHPFYFMATHAIFNGVNRYVLPRIGCFPVDREGTDNRALRKAQEILTAGKSPLVIFPEGEIYRLNDRITPLRDGVSAIALTSARKAKEQGRKTWIVPVGIKYRFMDSADPMPWMLECMKELELKFNWRPSPEKKLLERIYRYATGVLSLKEIEYLGGVRAGSVPDRVRQLREHVLEHVEQRIGLRQGKARNDSVPERVKECRRLILDRLTSPQRDEADLAGLRHELEDLFFVVQLYSYPGDYLQSRQTCERAWEILVKFRQDTLQQDTDRARYHVPRRAAIYIGEPIDVNETVSGTGKRPPENPAEPGTLAATSENQTGNEIPARSRRGLSVLSRLLEERIQALLDQGDPGRPLPVRN